MDQTHLYMFVDYDGVVKTFVEGFPFRHNRDTAPFNHAMIQILSYIAWKSTLPAYFIPISASPGSYRKDQLKKMFQEVYGVDNLDLHPVEPITEIRTNRQFYIKDILNKYQVKYHLVLDDEFFWYENQGLNYFRTDTQNGITYEVFNQMWDFADHIANNK